MVGVMRRRRILAAAGTALSSTAAGCLDGVLGGPPAGRQVALTDVGTVGSAHPLGLDATLRAATIGPDAAPRLEVTLRSTAEEALFLAIADSGPADGLLPDRDSEPRGLRLLAAAEASDLTVTYGRCPHTAYRPMGGTSAGGHRVDPGAKRRVTYLAVGSDQALAGACPPAGRYRFRSTYVYKRARSVERVGFEDAAGRRFDWGFGLEVPPDG